MAETFTVDLVVGGFTQKRARCHGQVRLFRTLQRQHRTRYLVDYVTWRQDWSDWLDFAHFMADGAALRLRVYAYSWGGARTIAGSIYRPSLAAECDRRGLRINHLALCDPVYFGPVYLMRWRAMLPRALLPALYLPENVDSAYVIRQADTLPQGAIIENPHKIPFQIVTVPRTTHESIADTIAWHLHCIDVATKKP